MGFLTMFFCIGSVLTQVAIAFDRYQAIINCLHYASRSHWQYAAKVIAWIWLQAFLCSLAPILGWGRYGYFKRRFLCIVDWTHHISYSVLVFTVCFLLPLALMGFCYLRIIRVARQHARRIVDISVHVSRANAERPPESLTPYGILALAMMDPLQRLNMFPQQQSSTTQNPNITVSLSGHGTGPVEEDNVSTISNVDTGAHSRREARATLRLLGLVLVFLICWLPYVVLHSQDAVYDHHNHRKDFSTSHISHAIATLLIFLSSAINPFSYAIGNKRFRFAVRKLGQKRQHTRTKRLTRDRQLSVATLLAALSRNRSRSSSTSGDLQNASKTTGSGSRKAPTERRTSALSLDRRNSAISMTQSSGQYLDVPRPLFIRRNSLPTTIHETSDTDSHDFGEVVATSDTSKQQPEDAYVTRKSSSTASFTNIVTSYSSHNNDSPSLPSESSAIQISVNNEIVNANDVANGQSRF